MRKVTYTRARQFWTTEARDLGEFLSVVKDTKRRWYEYWDEQRREVVGYWTPFEPTERIKVAGEGRPPSSRGSRVKRSKTAR